MIPIGPILSILGSGKAKLIGCIAGVVIVAVILAGMLLRIAFLKADIARLEGEKLTLNATVVTEQSKRANAETRANLAERDEAQLHKAYAGLELQVEDLRIANQEYLDRLERSREINRKAVVVQPEQTTGVVDHATSNSTVELLNSVFLRS
ncbi:hypothetical protein [Maridesulfovibrio sp.]|uniref:hypothetical protein n=1 Tax=Maridesulfovibrio sp. TaxID=2795000 RepID=UPI003B004920